MKRFNSPILAPLALYISMLAFVAGIHGQAADASDALFLQLGQPEKLQNERFEKALKAESSATQAVLENLDEKLQGLSPDETLSLVYIQDAGDSLERERGLLPALADKLRGHTDENTVLFIDMAEKPESSAQESVSHLALRLTRDWVSDGHVFFFRPEFGKDFEKKLKRASVGVGMIPGIAVGLTKVAIAHQFDLHSFWLAVESAFPVSIVAKTSAVALFAQARRLRTETLREGTYIRFANGQPVAQEPMRPGYANVKQTELMQRARYAQFIRKRADANCSYSTRASR